MLAKEDKYKVSGCVSFPKCIPSNRQLDRARSALLSLLYLTEAFSMVVHDMLTHILRHKDTKVSLTVALFLSPWLGAEGGAQGRNCLSGTHLNVVCHKERFSPWCCFTWLASTCAPSSWLPEDMSWVVIIMSMNPSSICWWVDNWTQLQTTWRGLFKPWLEG